MGEPVGCYSEIFTCLPLNCAQLGCGWEGEGVGRPLVGFLTNELGLGWSSSGSMFFSGGQLDIQKGHNSEWFLLKFLFQRIIISKFLSQKVIIPKIFSQPEE